MDPEIVLMGELSVAESRYTNCDTPTEVDIIEDQVSVVSASNVGLRGESDNMVKKSEGHHHVKHADGG